MPKTQSIRRRTKNSLTTRPTKIFIDGRFLSQPVTGVQRYGRELLSAFDALVNEQKMASSITIEVLVPPGCAIDLALRHIRIRQVGWFSGHLWEQLILPLAVKGGVLFCPGNTAPIVSLLFGQPVAVTVHSLSFLYQPASYTGLFRCFYRALVGLICRFAKAVITPSESEKQVLVSRYPAAADRIHDVQNGSVPRAFTNETKKARDCPHALKERFVLFVGSLVESKNLQTLLEAMEIVNHQTRLVLRVVGSCGKGLQPAKYRIAPSVKQLVNFDGQVSVDRLVQSYRDASCLVLPSYYEASPLPPLEAMALGCPVLVSRIPALVERCGDAALYFDPRSAADIAHQISQVMDNSDLRAALRQKGFERAAAFSWERTAAETLAVILKVAGNDGNAAARIEDSPGNS
jgi:glycosyltransferase involved in cell wall biosynthesis